MAARMGRPAAVGYAGDQSSRVRGRPGIAMRLPNKFTAR
jgi:hypothetical protein